MAQLFVNNGRAVLAAPLSSSTSGSVEFMTIAAGSNIPFAATTYATDFFACTLTDGTDYEIIHVFYDHLDNTATYRSIKRGQEGTTARAWVSGTPMIAPLTAEAMGRMFRRGAGDAPVGLNAVSLILNETQGGASGEEAVAVGHRAAATGNNSVSLNGYAYGAYSNALGMFSKTGPVAENSTAIGQVYIYPPNTFGIWGFPAAQASDYHWGVGYEFSQGTGEWYGVSALLDLTTTHTITAPIANNTRFFLNEVGILIEGANTVTVQPTISFGIPGNSGKYLAAVATSGLTAAWKRQRFTSLLSDSDGETQLEAKVTVGATATTLTGRFYWRGFSVILPGL